MTILKWLADLSSDQLSEFLRWLRALYPTNGSLSSAQRLRREQIRQVFIPIIEAGLADNDFLVPENLEFQTLLSHLGLNRYTINQELRVLHYNMSRPINTKIAARYLRKRPRTVQELAQSGRIPAAKTKYGWLFQLADLNNWLQKQQPRV